MLNIKVLSLFDGISCGRVALERENIPVEKYVAYEINEYAIKVSQKNYPQIEHYGDVMESNFLQYKNFDLLIGGSPCQGLSSSNVYLKDGEYGVEGTGKSRLFWEYVRALKTINPRYFLFENVASMKNEDKKIITEQLGVEPIKIDSILFSGQVRRRLYWTNIPVVMPNKRLVSTTLKDIIITNTALDRYYLKEGTLNYVLSQGTGGWRSGNLILNPQYGRPVVASCWKIHRADTDSYITTDYKPIDRTNVRRLLPIECERLQTLPDNYTLIDENYSICQLDKNRWEAIGNGWTVDVIAYILSFIPKD